MAIDPYNSNQRLRRRPGGNPEPNLDFVAPAPNARVFNGPMNKPRVEAEPTWQPPKLPVTRLNVIQGVNPNAPFDIESTVGRGTDKKRKPGAVPQPAGTDKKRKPGDRDYDALQRDNTDFDAPSNAPAQKPDTANDTRRAPGSFKRKDLPGVVQGRATINGVEQNVYSGSAFDPLMFGVANLAQRAEALKRRPELAATFNEYDKFAGAQHAQENQRADAAAAARAAQAAELQMAAVTKERAPSSLDIALDAAKLGRTQVQTAAADAAARAAADKAQRESAQFDPLDKDRNSLMAKLPVDATQDDVLRASEAADFLAFERALQAAGGYTPELAASKIAQRAKARLEGIIAAQGNSDYSLASSDLRRQPLDREGVVPNIDLSQVKTFGATGVNNAIDNAILPWRDADQYYVGWDVQGSDQPRVFAAGDPDDGLDDLFNNKGRVDNLLRLMRAGP